MGIVFPWAEAKPEGDCLVWSGATDADGYAYFKRLGHRSRRAHRAAYESVHGRPPTGFVVMHTCDRPACVNPAHLVPGTQKQNVADMIAKGRRGTPYPGSKNPYKAFTGRKLGQKDKAPRKKKAPTPVKESRPCTHSSCTYEIGGRWDCEYDF